jgi:hypothetical protein
MMLENISSMMLYLLVVLSVILIPTKIVMDYYNQSLKKESINICRQIH